MSINDWIDIAAQPESLPEETQPNVEEWVFQPCIESPLSPREARAILEIFGYYANIGIRPALLLSSVVLVVASFFKRLKQEA